MSTFVELCGFGCAVTAAFLGFGVVVGLFVLAAALLLVGYSLDEAALAGFVAPLRARLAGFWARRVEQ